MVKEKQGEQEDDEDTAITKPKITKKDIFISYCWSNSYLSKEANEVKSLSGNEFNDPRRIKSLLAEKYADSGFSFH